MELIITSFENYDLLQIAGRIDSYTAPNIQKAIKSLISDGRFNFVVDMCEVIYISSSGILTFVHQQLNLNRQNQGKIVFAGTSDLVYSGFELAGFHFLFEFFDDVQSAIDGF